MTSYSIAGDDVFVGVWTDYSQPYGFRTTLTLGIQNARYVISAISLFITIVGSCVWSIITFFIHRYLATEEETDGVSLHLRLLYRNAGSPSTTLWQIKEILQAWRKSKLRPNATKIKRRAAIFAIPPSVNIIVFGALSILGAKIAGSDYESNTVLLRSGNCGPINWNQDLTELERFQLFQFQLQLALNETQAARAYAHNCYQSESRGTECSMFPSRSIPYDVKMVSCPFGTDPAGNSLCLPENNQAIEFSTKLLDTDAMFGINAAKERRILLRKSLTCSPIRITEYIRTENQGLDNAVTYLDMGPVIGVSDYTFAYRQRSRDDKVGYQLVNLLPTDGIWSPVDALRVSHGDTSVNILASNSISYLEPVKDLWFSANNLVNDSSPLPSYISDNDISVLACVDRSQVCNPNHNPSSCTLLGSGSDIAAGYRIIGLNNYQTVTARRLGQILPMASTFTAVNGLGSAALLASTNVASLVSTGLPPDQWQREARDWFETGLAAMQAGVVRWAKNTIDLGNFGHIVHPDPKVQIAPASYFCGNQRLRNVGQYVSFSFLGLMITLWVGVFLIVLSWFIETADKSFRKLKNRRSGPQHPHLNRREISWIADQYLQLSRKALCADGNNDHWENRLKKVPVTRGDRMFPLPKLHEPDEGLDFYFPTEAEAHGQKQAQAEPANDVEASDAADEQHHYQVETPPEDSTLPSPHHQVDESEEKDVVSTTTHEVYHELRSPSPVSSISSIGERQHGPAR